MNRQIALLLLGLFVALACEPTALFYGAPPTITPDRVATGVAEQKAIAATLTALAPKPTDAPPTPRVVPTAIPPATPTLVPVVFPTAIPPTAIPTLPTNRIRMVQAMDINSSRLQVTVEYLYSGEWGASNVYMTATGWNEQAQIAEIYPDRQPISPGDGAVTLLIELHDRGTFFTSRLQFCMFAEGSAPRIYCQFWPYPRQWVRNR